MKTVILNQDIIFATELTHAQATEIVDKKNDMMKEVGIRLVIMSRPREEGWRLIGKVDKAQRDFVADPNKYVIDLED